MIRVNQIKKTFDDLQVLKGMSLDVQEGEVIVMIGPSGSGKTTFLRSINALEIPEDGAVTIGDIKIDYSQKPSENLLRSLRSQIGMVFQNFNLFPHLTVLENVMEGLVTVQRISKHKAREIAADFLEKVGLKEKINEFPSALSGGQQQRVAIARALATNPKVILFDEPTSALDVELVSEVLKVMKKLASEGMTMIIVTHEINFAKEVADKIVFIDNGHILDILKPDELNNKSNSERLQKFLNLIENK
ncbi:amino acid ABC transporter ATP-binding protein [Haloplasma contractile]|uniref:Cystine transport system ATP-binding protein n=1 Tax=Haloplasma contractile SSD-17B TaxID=1033810 RepID=U2E8G1_9MOLU|nr:amino acid ABC transporter ATP-binding protein [Haloplasma contractile]ERJ11181.1 cystine transport system ATP-binding protein [Haloplasma contractile SSD-17B]